MKKKLYNIYSIVCVIDMQCVQSAVAARLLHYMYYITLSPENPTHSNNLMIIGGRRDNTWKNNKNEELFWLNEVFLPQLHSTWPIRMNVNDLRIYLISVTVHSLTKLNPPIPKWTPPSKSFSWVDWSEDLSSATMSRQVL